MPCPRCLKGHLVNNYGEVSCINCSYVPDTTLAQQMRWQREFFGDAGIQVGLFLETRKEVTA